MEDIVRFEGAILLICCIFVLIDIVLIVYWKYFQRVKKLFLRIINILETQKRCIERIVKTIEK